MKKKPFEITIINLVSLTGYLIKMSDNVEACLGNLVFPLSCPSGNLPKTRFFDPWVTYIVFVSTQVVLWPFTKYCHLWILEGDYKLVYQLLVIT